MIATARKRDRSEINGGIRNGSFEKSILHHLDVSAPRACPVIVTTVT